MKDCIIVCGYPTNEDGTLSHILKSRIDKAIELYQRQQSAYIIVSGGAIHNQFSESEAMAKYAITQGILQTRIIIENEAKSTYHNMMYSQVLMQENGFQNCYIVTNSWHIIKAEYYAKKFHLDYCMVKANKPEGMSCIHNLLLHIEMPINMLINRMKGYK